MTAANYKLSRKLTVKVYEYLPYDPSGGDPIIPYYFLCSLRSSCPLMSGVVSQ